MGPVMIARGDTNIVVCQSTGDHIKRSRVERIDETVLGESKEWGFWNDCLFFPPFSNGSLTRRSFSSM